MKASIKTRIGKLEKQKQQDHSDQHREAIEWLAPKPLTYNRSGGPTEQCKYRIEITKSNIRWYEDMKRETEQGKTAWTLEECNRGLEGHRETLKRLESELPEIERLEQEIKLSGWYQLAMESGDANSS